MIGYALIALVSLATAAHLTRRMIRDLLDLIGE